jgi:hypothetical protein
VSWLIAGYIVLVLAASFWAEIENAIDAEIRAFEDHQREHTEMMKGRSLAGKPVLVVYDTGQRRRRITGLVAARFGPLRPLVRAYVRHRAL